jgi:hypothetical protein
LDFSSDFKELFGDAVEGAQFSALSNSKVDAASNFKFLPFAAECPFVSGNSKNFGAK